MSDIFTLDENNNAAVRTVGVKAGAVESNQPDIFTTDENGNAAVRVVGGGDSSNLGYFATLEALQEAYPTAEPGNWAIVGTTDTVWIWDSDTSAWKDSDQKGQVTSVNNQTGDVNIKSINGNSLMGTGNLQVSGFLPFPAGWTTNSTTKALCDDIAADTTTVKGSAFLGEVTCSDLPASIANSEINVYINDGTTAADKVIILELTSGNVAPYRWIYVYWNGGTDVSGWKTWQEPLVSGTNIKTINGSSVLGSGDLTISGLPSQTGNAGKFLTTDGTDASWSDKPLVNTATGSDSVITGGASTNSTAKNISIGSGATSGGSSVSIGDGAKATRRGIALGTSAEATASGGLSDYSIAIGLAAIATASRSIQINTGTNSDANTVKFGNANGNFEIMSADGTIPEARLADTTSATEGPGCQ